MKIDRQTLRDLEVIPGAPHAGSLTAHLDRTSTTGGGRVWKHRLSHPLKSIEEVREVQAALQFMISQRRLFADLPTEGEINAVDRYLRSNFATITSTSGVAFWIEATWVRARYPDLYRAAVEGGLSLGLVWRRMTRIAEGLRSAPALLARMAKEIQAFADDEGTGELIKYVQRGDTGSWGQVLAADRIARHEARGSVGRILQLAHELDALRSMALATEDLGFCFPDLHTDRGALEVRGMWHPFLEAAVANDLSFGPTGRLIFLTGPNMAGKTTYVKACGITILLAHVGMGVPARACSLGFMERLVCAIRTEDSLWHGVSYFQAEARRVRSIAEWLAIEERTVVLVDELFRGTNVKDAGDATEAVIRGFRRAPHSFFVISSHLIEVAPRIESLPGVGFQQFAAEVVAGGLSFSYRAREGVSSQRLGMEVLRGQGVLEALQGIGRSTHPVR